jgi:hypothetical protein
MFMSLWMEPQVYLLGNQPIICQDQSSFSSISVCASFSYREGKDISGNTYTEPNAGVHVV